MLLATLLTVTLTEPVVAPVGTGTTMELVLQLVGVAAVPLNLTVLVPRVAPKFDPVIVTTAPIAPDVGERLVMCRSLSVEVTVKPTALLATLLTVTTTDPLVAPPGTGATMRLAVQLLGAAAVPLNLMLLVPCDAPKFAPLMVTAVPTFPDVGERFTILGAVGDVKSADTSAENGLFSPAVLTACAAKK